MTNTDVPTEVVAVSENRFDAIVPWEGGQKRIAVYSTMPPEDTLNLMVTAGKIRDQLNKVLLVTDVIVHRATVVDQDGEDIPGRRTVLVCTDGNAYAGMSEGVMDSLELIVAAYGPPPWTDGLELVPVAVETRRGFTTFRLVPPKKAKGKK